MTLKTFVTKYGASLAGLALAPLALLIVGAALSYDFAHNRAMGEAVQRSYQERQQMQTVFSLMQDAEIGQRGFMLTGRPEFLDPYWRSLRRLEAERRTLRRMQTQEAATTNEQPEELAELAELDGLIEAKLVNMSQAIALRRQGPIDPDPLMAREAGGKQIMDAIRDRVEKMVAAEQAQLDRRVAAEADRRRGSEAFVVSVLALFGGLVLMSFLIAFRQTRARQAALEAAQASARAQEAMAADLSRALSAAEAATQIKSQFLANMSHELRTPLNGVIGFSRLLAESRTLSSEDRHRVRLVRGAGEALNSLINDILDFSKLEAGAVELEVGPFLLADLVSEALSMVEPAASEKGLSLAISGPDLGIRVGDRNRLRQVLLNLLSNAVKFTAQGGVEVVIGPGTESEDHVRIAIVDQGVGIAPDKIGQLFARFTQADASVARTYGGTGLGLAISRELVQLMGGQIGVESQEGEGATFWFELPLPVGVLSESAPRRERGRAIFPGRRVLVVDDVALNRELCDVLLRQHSCEVTLANDGAEAVAAVAAQTFDLILMDLHMPGMDGLAATRAIRASAAADVPILALTASGAPDQIALCLAAGMDGHLLKPLSASELEAALSRTFHGAPADVVETGSADGRQSFQAEFEETFGAASAANLVRLALDQLTGRFEGEARDAVREDAHKVAGSAGMVGEHRLSGLASRLEELCLGGADIEGALLEVRDELASALRRLSSWREDLLLRAAD